MQKLGENAAVPVVEVGVFGGHMNGHPVGQMVLHRLIDIAKWSLKEHKFMHTSTKKHTEEYDNLSPGDSKNGYRRGEYGYEDVGSPGGNDMNTAPGSAYVHAHAHTHTHAHTHAHTHDVYEPSLRVTLIALGLFPDAVTKHIASKVSSIVNLPLDTSASIQMVHRLGLDVVLMPDWQPFPDGLNGAFLASRVAPVQVST
jgi:hypothetical protein